MRHIKKIASLLLALVLTIAMTMPVLAAAQEKPKENTGKITIKESETVKVKGKTFTIYRILDAELSPNGEIVYRTPDIMKEFYETYPWTNSDGTPRSVGKSTDAAFDQNIAEAIAEIGKNAVTGTGDEEDEKNGNAPLARFAKAALKAASEAKTAKGNYMPIFYETKTAEEGNTRVIFDKLALGYYLISDDTAPGNVSEDGADVPISALMLDTTNADVEVSIKASQPTVDKHVNREQFPDDGKDADGRNAQPFDPNDTTADNRWDWQGSNNAAIGETVEYLIDKITVPDMRGYKYYQMMLTDTMSEGLTFDGAESVHVWMEDADGNYKELKQTSISDGEVAAADDNTETYAVTVTNLDAEGNEIPGEPTGAHQTRIKVIFKDFLQYSDRVGSQILIYYTATVNEYAKLGNVGENQNSVKLTYSNDPDPDVENEEPGDEPGEKDPTGETPENNTYTYVTGLQLTKVDGKDNATKLKGAQFRLTGIRIKRTLVTGYRFEVHQDGEFYGIETSVKDDKGNPVIAYTKDSPDTPGMDTTKYLKDEEGKYQKFIREKYDKMEVEEEVEDRTLEVGDDGILKIEGLAEGTYTLTELKAPNGYNMLKGPVEIKIEWAPAVIKDSTDEEDPKNCVWSGTYKMYDETAEKPIETFTEDGLLAFNVVNNSGTELPSTGGMGTTILYIVGGILVLGAVIILISRKRAHSQQ